LIWEKKTDDSGIHDKDRQFTGDTVDAQFIDRLNRDEFGGFSDWRLPNIRELATINHKGKMVSPMINEVYCEAKPHPLGVVKWIWLSQSRMGMA
jgi:hypothetical protein